MPLDFWFFISLTTLITGVLVAFLSISDVIQDFIKASGVSMFIVGFCMIMGALFSFLLRYVLGLI